MAEDREKREFLRQLKARLKHIDPYEYAKEVKRQMEDGLSDQVVSQAAARLRTDPRIVARWLDYTGAEDYEGIDWTNPCVYIEWSACDITLMSLVDDADAFVEATGCDRETFMRYYWPKSENA